jgi:N utilization substance protein A
LRPRFFFVRPQGFVAPGHDRHRAVASAAQHDMGEHERRIFVRQDGITGKQAGPTMTADLIRFIDSISRDKNIDKESVFADLEAAMVSAVRKANELAEDVVVQIDRQSGMIAAAVDGSVVDMKTLGRIAAQTAKQVMIQKIREDERNSIFEEYSQRVGTVVTGNVVRYDGGGLVVNLSRVEAFMPRSEMIPGEAHHPG